MIHGGKSAKSQVPNDSLSSRFAFRYPRGFAVYVARPAHSIPREPSNLNSKLEATPIAWDLAIRIPRSVGFRIWNFVIPN